MTTLDDILTPEVRADLEGELEAVQERMTREGAPDGKYSVTLTVTFDLGGPPDEVGTKVASKVPARERAIPTGPQRNTRGCDGCLRSKVCDAFTSGGEACANFRAERIG